MRVVDHLSDFTKWTKGEPARTRKGDPCTADHPQAVMWCLLGSINHCYHTEQERNRAMRLVTQAVERRGGSFIHKWQDDPRRTFEEVRELIVECGI